MTSNSAARLRSVLVGLALTATASLAATVVRAQDTGAGFGAQVTTDGVTQGGWGFGAAEGARDRGFAFASGSADLELVALKALAATSPTGPGGCAPGSCTYSSQAAVSLWDTIILTNTTSASVVVPYEFLVTGSLDMGEFGNATALTTSYFGDNPARWFSTTLVSLNGDYVRSGSLSLQANETRTFYWRAYLSTTATKGGVSDYSHTMTFDWDLPEGVTYASRSGAFMAAVPEPTSWALMILGFGSAGAMVRARRRLQFA